MAARVILSLIPVSPKQWQIRGSGPHRAAEEDRNVANVRPGTYVDTGRYQRAPARADADLSAGQSRCRIHAGALFEPRRWRAEKRGLWQDVDPLRHLDESGNCLRNAQSGRRDMRIGVRRLQTRSSAAVRATTWNIWMDTHGAPAGDGDRAGAGSDSFRRHQLHHTNGQLARRDLALYRTTGSCRARKGDHGV